MPTSNPRINDPEGQSVMDAWLEAGVEPSSAYNATQGIHNMASDRVAAEIGALRAEVTAEIEAFKAEVTVRIDALEATTAASIDALAAATSARLDAIDAQITLLTWAMIATFAIVTGLAATGFFRMSGWWTPGSSGSGSQKSPSTDG